MPSIHDLETRTSGLPEFAKSRLRDDAELQALLQQVTALANRIASEAEVSEAAIEEIEALQAALVSTWETKLGQAALDVAVVSETVSEIPVCRFCGASFQVPADASSRASWARLRAHVKNLHPREWAAAQPGEQLPPPAPRP